MQSVVLPKPSTLNNFGSSVTEAISTMLYKISGGSRVPTYRSTRKQDPEKGRMSESSLSQHRKKKANILRSANGDAYCESFSQTMLSRKCRKACEDTSLVLATIATACICSLPTVTYFTVMVSH